MRHKKDRERRRPEKVEGEGGEEGGSENVQTDRQKLIHGQTEKQIMYHQYLCGD